MEILPEEPLDRTFHDCFWQHPGLQILYVMCQTHWVQSVENWNKSFPEMSSLSNGKLQQSIAILRQPYLLIFKYVHTFFIKTNIDKIFPMIPKPPKSNINPPEIKHY